MTEDSNLCLRTSLSLHTPDTNDDLGEDDDVSSYLDHLEAFEHDDFNDRIVNFDKVNVDDPTLTIKANSSSQGSCLL